MVFKYLASCSLTFRPWKWRRHATTNHQILFGLHHVAVLKNSLSHCSKNLKFDRKFGAFCSVTQYTLVEGYWQFSTSLGIEAEVFSEVFVVSYRPARRLFKVLALPSDLPHGILNLHWVRLSKQKFREGWLSDNALDYHSGGARFESLLGHRLTWDIFVFSYIPSREIKECYLE